MTHATWMASVVFDGARSIKRLAPDLDLHCARLVRSAEAFGLKPTHAAEVIFDLACEGIGKFPADAELYIRPMFWAESGWVAPDPDSTRFALIVYVSPLSAPTGLSVCLSSRRRPAPDMAPTDAKAACLYPNAGRALREAVEEVDFPVHGVVDMVHWKERLSSPNPGSRATGVAALKRAIRDSYAIGGSSVLLVPGKVSGDEENHDHVWQRSIIEIRKVLPLASRLGIHVLIENVWNGFCYTHNGPADQTADKLAAYLDAIDSPWVGSYFDIGNHQKYGKPAQWIRTLGKRIVKLDVKDWGKKNGFCKIGDGDVDWAEVRKALLDIEFTGWCTAEVAGGKRDRIEDGAKRMNVALGL
mgnify:CR=1 FL=1